MNKFDQDLGMVIQDKHSGSVAILQRLIQAITSYLNQEEDSVKSLNEIQDRMPTMTGSLAHFAVVNHFLSELKYAITQYKNDPIETNKLIDFVITYDETWKNANTSVAEMAFRNIDCQGKTILLHSNSSTIVSFFQKLKNEGIEVFAVQTESRPENEGRQQAEEIAGLGYEVTFVVDAAAPCMLNQVDLMIVGADQIHPNYFVNKIGTYPLALACKERKIPVYVLADSRKISGLNADPEPMYTIRKSGSEIWKPTHRKIQPVNFYFETIPSALVHSFVTESRIILPSKIGQPD